MAVPYNGIMIQSVQRAFRILYALAESPDGLGVNEVSAQTGLTTSTAHNLLSTLAADGFAERLSSPARYRIGPAIQDLASRQLTSAWASGLDEAVRQVACRWPKATVVQCDLVAGEIVAQRRCSPDIPGRLQRPAHQAMSPYTSASGLCWLAFGPAEDRRAIESRFPLADYAGHCWGSGKELSEHLASIRAIGYVSDRRDGLVRVSVPVLSEASWLSRMVTLGASMEVADAAGSAQAVTQLIADLQCTARDLCEPKPNRKEASRVDQ